MTNSLPGKLLFIATSVLVFLGCGEETGSDKVLPPIILLGDAVDTAYLNTTYRTADPAAVIEIEGSRRQDIKVTGSVNTTAPGTYYLDYDYSDAEGNRAATVTRTVHVVLTRTDSVNIQQMFEMYKSIGIASQWRSIKNDNQIRIKTSSEPLIYLEYQKGTQLLLYNVIGVSHRKNDLILKTTSHFGDTVCFWTFAPDDRYQGGWSRYQPLKSFREDLGTFLAEER